MLGLINKSSAIHIAGILAMVLALSYNFSNIFSMVASQKSSVKAEGKALNTGHPKSVNDFASVVEKNPFGINNARFFALLKGQAAATDAGGLILKGVITYKPGFAFIENRSGLQKLFRTGDYVHGSGKLSAVYADRVSISTGGKVTDLKLQDIKSVSAPSATNKASAGRPLKNVRDVTFDRDQIKRFLENPNEILTGARLTPVIKDNRQEGFVVREIRPGGLYELIGLRNEDIILRANNIDLNSPGDGVKIFNMIKELDRMELDIIRNGSPLTQMVHIN